MLSLWHKPKLLIVVRQSPDWRRLTFREFAEQARIFQSSIHNNSPLIEAVRLWDRTFKTTFFEVRQAMKEIARRNLRKIKGAKILDALPANFPPNLPVVFIDDDDWLAPDIALKLRGESEGYLFDQVLFGYLDNPDGVSFRDGSGFCFTNNYAVSSDLLNRRPVFDFYQHSQANETFKQLRATHVPEYLCATNKHPCSTIFLEHSLKGDFSGAALRAIVGEYLSLVSSIAPFDLKAHNCLWAYPFIKEVRDFFTARSFRA